jgi:hypothetical protein
MNVLTRVEKKFIVTNMSTGESWEVIAATTEGAVFWVTLVKEGHDYADNHPEIVGQKGYAIGDYVGRYA